MSPRPKKQRPTFITPSPLSRRNRYDGACLTLKGTCMTGPYTRDKIENWVSDFCVSDALRHFSPTLRDLAGSILLAFFSAACERRNIEPEDLEEADIQAAL